MGPVDPTDEEPAVDPLTELSDDELEEELTLAASRPHGDERYQELVAELERRRNDP